MFSNKKYLVFGSFAGFAAGAALFSLAAFTCDCLPWRPLQLILFAAIIIWHARGVSWQGFRLILCLAGLSYLIARLLSLNVSFTIYLSYATTEDFVLATLNIYFMHDDSINTIAAEWRNRVVGCLVYWTTSLLLFCGRPILHHTTAHWREVDRLSVLLSLLVLLAVLP
jgi:hypothetical protein